MTAEHGRHPSRLVSRGRIDRSIPRFGGPMNFVCGLQCVRALGFIPFRHMCGVCRGVIVYTRGGQTCWPEHEFLNCLSKRHTRLFLNYQGKKVVSGMLFVQKLRTWLEEQRLTRNLLDQSRRGLMVLQDFVVVGQRIDVRQSRALDKKIANRNLLCSRNAGDKPPTWSSNLIKPLSTRRKTAAAVNCIDIDAIWNRVAGVFSTLCSRSARP